MAYVYIYLGCTDLYKSAEEEVFVVWWHGCSVWDGCTFVIGVRV